MNPCEECTHVLSDETGKAVIVDCGAYYPNERRHLLEYIEKEQLRPVRLLLTHAHHDYVYGNDLIHDHFGLLPEVHEADKELMTVQLRERIDEIYHEYPYPLPMPEHYLTDEEIIRFGNHELRVIHTHQGIRPAPCSSIAKRMGLHSQATHCSTKVSGVLTCRVEIVTS